MKPPIRVIYRGEPHLWTYKPRAKNRVGTIKPSEMHPGRYEFYPDEPIPGIEFVLAFEDELEMLDSKRLESDADCDG